MGTPNATEQDVPAADLVSGAPKTPDTPAKSEISPATAESLLLAQVDARAHFGRTLRHLNGQR